MNIRPVAMSDVENIGSIHVESWHETYRGLIPDAVLDSVTVCARVAMWRNTIEHHSATTPIFVAEVAAGDIVGFAAGGPSHDPSLGCDAEVYAIYILHREQGKGCGRALMRELAGALQERHFASFCLWVFRDNPSARGFYERLGGQLVAEKVDDSFGGPLYEVAYRWPTLSAVTSTS